MNNPIGLNFNQVRLVSFGVSNINSHTSTYALTNVTLKYARDIARFGLEEAVRRDEALRKGVNVYRGKVTHAAVASGVGEKVVELATLV